MQVLWHAQTVSPGEWQLLEASQLVWVPMGTLWLRRIFHERGKASSSCSKPLLEAFLRSWKILHSHVPCGTVRRGPPPRKRKPPPLPRDARTDCRQRPVAAGLQHSPRLILASISKKTPRPHRYRCGRGVYFETDGASERGLWRALSFMTRDMQESCAGCSLAKPQAEAGADQRST